MITTTYTTTYTTPHVMGPDQGSQGSMGRRRSVSDPGNKTKGLHTKIFQEPTTNYNRKNQFAIPSMKQGPTNPFIAKGLENLLCHALVSPEILPAKRDFSIQSFSAHSHRTASENEKLTAAYFNAMISQKEMLLMFLKELPKTDLHKHAEGSIWNEDFLEFLKEQKNIFYDPDKHTFHGKFRNGRVSADTLKSDAQLRRGFQGAVSMPNLAPKDGDGYTRFFEACRHVENTRRFMTLTEQIYPVMSKAVVENLFYQELMIEVPVLPIPKKFLESFNINKLDEAVEEILPWAKQYIEIHVKELKTCSEQVGNKLGWNCPITSLDAPIPTKFRCQIMRNRANIAEFFAECFAAIKLQFVEPNVVAFSVVGPEHDPTSLEQFSDQLKILKYLRDMKDNPWRPNYSLHAGELTACNSKPEDRMNKISRSIHEGGANAISHGVCLTDEQNFVSILQYMSEQRIPLEVCLTSNKLILGAKPPLEIYTSFGVPCVMGGDDEGIFRATLTDSLILAVFDHHMRYKDIKGFIRNGVTCSYLKGNSIWKGKKLYPMFQGVSDLAWEASKSAEDFMKNSDKARMEVNLERKLVALEAKWGGVWALMKKNRLSV